MKNVLITDFKEACFQQAFQKYFKELGIQVNNWEGLFEEMNSEGDNKAYVRLTEENEIVGFIQFKLIKLTNWFFEERLGFVREFWIADQYRNDGHGSALLDLAEEYFVENGIFKSILTTDTAEKFYLNRGYQKDLSYKALNEDFVYIKELKNGDKKNAVL